jgi:hypothetical protein
MENKNKIDTEQQKIESLLSSYLVSRNPLKSSTAETSFHLDEDSLAAFVEGNIGEREARPLVRHLVDCGFCRHKSVELLRLDLEFEGAETVAETSTAKEPSKISEVLGGLFAKIFGNAEGAVFAHEEKDDESEPKPSEEEKKNEDEK